MWRFGVGTAFQIEARGHYILPLPSGRNTVFDLLFCLEMGGQQFQKPLVGLPFCNSSSSIGQGTSVGISSTTKYMLPTYAFGDKGNNHQVGL